MRFEINKFQYVEQIKSRWVNAHLFSFVFLGVFEVSVTNAVSNGESFVKFGIEGVEVLAVQVVLNYSEPVTHLTKSKRCGEALDT